VVAGQSQLAGTKLLTVLWEVEVAHHGTIKIRKFHHQSSLAYSSDGVCAPPLPESMQTALLQA
jgi:hypothetical protein